MSVGKKKNARRGIRVGQEAYSEATKQSQRKEMNDAKTGNTKADAIGGNRGLLLCKLGCPYSEKMFLIFLQVELRTVKGFTNSYLSF